MSFSSDLKQVSNLDEAQTLFESEVKRISKLTVYQQSKDLYDKRLMRIQNDIYNHLDKLNVKGVLYFYDHMQYGNLYKTINNNRYDDDSFTESDRVFFRRLWAFLVVYSVCFISFVIYLNHVVKPVSNNVSRETLKHKVDASTSIEQATRKNILKDDEIWTNR